jgi:hypothetical protein
MTSQSVLSDNTVLRASVEEEEEEEEVVVVSTHEFLEAHENLPKVALPLRAMPLSKSHPHPILYV